MTEPNLKPQPKIAIIGTGLSSLIAARTIADHGFDVTVFEKSRGIGGRMSTRRTDAFGQFDHGAQYFTARDDSFRRCVLDWQQQGHVANWPDSDTGQKIVVIKNGQVESESASQERFVSVPAMNSIGKHLASELNIVLKTRIARIETGSPGHQLYDDSGECQGVFDLVISSAPAEQTCDLLPERHVLQNLIRAIEMQPCWAAMVAVEKPVAQDWVGAFVHDSFLSWVGRNSTKPGRDARYENLVIHANPEWTTEHWEHDPEDVADLMLQEFWRASACDPQTPVYRKSHRWKYALAKEPSQEQCFFDAETMIGACGDWANGSRVEGAFLSGQAIAGKVVERLSQN